MTNKRDPKLAKTAKQKRLKKQKPVEKDTTSANLLDQAALGLDAAPFDWSVKGSHPSSDAVHYIDRSGPVPVDARTLLAIHKVLMLANRAHELDDYLKQNPTYVAASPNLVNTLKAKIAKTNSAKLRRAIDDVLKPDGDRIPEWPHDIDP
ncbi:MAG: hypothetical protein PGN33_10285 [Methylobacterium radiotolerans]